MTINRTRELCNVIAEAAGVNPRAIASIVELSNEKKLIFRGVRCESEWVNHAQGILVNSGDEQASFWTTGLRIFSASEEHLQQYDTTFFHYAPGKKGLLSRMYITATPALHINAQYSCDSLVKVKRNLSSSEFSRIEVVGGILDQYEDLYPIMVGYLLNYCNS